VTTLPIQILHTFEVGEPVTAIAWSPAGDQIAVGSYKTIRIFRLDDAEPRLTFLSKQRVWRMAWSSDGKMLASAWEGRGVEILDAETGRHLNFVPSTAQVAAFAWSLSRLNIAICDSAGRIKVWSVPDDETVAVAQLGVGVVTGICWDSTGDRIAFSGRDSLPGVWNIRKSRTVPQTPAYFGKIVGMEWLRPDSLVAGFDSGAVVMLSTLGSETVVRRMVEVGASVFALGGLDSQRFFTLDGLGRISIWSADSGDLLDRYDHPVQIIAKHPTESLAAAPSGDDNSVLKVFPLVRETPGQQVEPMSRYRNAKIVVVGESGSGKSGLSLVLAGKPFEPTLSTHGTHVFTVSDERVPTDDGFERRELLLWDLAGQPGYRLTHQLHLNEVAVALLVFDSRHERDPFADVPYWLQALAQAERFNGQQRIRRMLVSARNDRSGTAVGVDRLKRFVDQNGIDRVFTTSALEGRGVEELRREIIAAIPWDELPQVTSSVMFDDMMQFVVEEKQAGRLLTKLDDLYRLFAARASQHATQPDAARQFETCIGRLQSRGLVRRLRFGNLVLLQPEYLDAYASAIVNAARDEPDGLGSMAEERIVAAQFHVPSDARVKNAADEKLLLIATVEDLVAHELAIREPADDGIQLVFPSQLLRENPDLPEPDGKAVTFCFAGPVLNIYATLVVRLSHSGVFRKSDMWKDSVMFNTGGTARCGVFLTNLGNGRAELTLFYFDAPEAIRRQFEDYVFTHLTRRASSEAIGVRRAVICGKCGKSQPDALVRMCETQGRTSFFCYACGKPIPMSTVSEAPHGDDDAVDAIDRRADAARDQETARIALAGKRIVNDFDVFLCHNSVDKDAVKRLARQLAERGVNAWLDEWQLRPGLPWQRALEKQIAQIQSAAVFVGASGIGPWQYNELEAVLHEFVKRGVPVIPVLLDNAGAAPDLPMFLRGRTWVDFRETIPPPLDQLVWGITGQPPDRTSYED
jgi:WD40 repeat protein